MRRPSEQLEAFFLTKAMVLAFLVPLLVHEAKHKFKIFFNGELSLIGNSSSPKGAICDTVILICCYFSIIGKFLDGNNCCLFIAGVLVRSIICFLSLVQILLLFST